MSSSEKRMSKPTGQVEYVPSGGDTAALRLELAAARKTIRQQVKTMAEMRRQLVAAEKLAHPMLSAETEARRAFVRQAAIAMWTSENTWADIDECLDCAVSLWNGCERLLAALEDEEATKT